MNATPTVKLAEDRLRVLTMRALVCHGLREPAALACARKLVDADACGLESHGVARVPMYCRMLETGRIAGDAQPFLIDGDADAASAAVDADGGIGYDACDLAVRDLAPRARRHGIAFVGIRHSTHVGALGLHLEPLARDGLVAIALSAAPAAMPFANGRAPVLGTNPVAAIFPRPGQAPLLIDMSMTTVARGHIMFAAQRGDPIPEGWALDREGQPTTDARAALDGSLLPVGGEKGSMLALCFELLCSALTGAQPGFMADPFYADQGNAPRLGQVFIAFDPRRLAGTISYAERVEAVVERLCTDPAVRLPGSRRDALRAVAARDGIAVPGALVERLERLGALLGSGRQSPI